MYEEAMYHKRMLMSAGSRLAKPALTASFSHWRHDWDAAQRAALAENAKSATGVVEQLAEARRRLVAMCAARDPPVDRTAAIIIDK